MSEHRGAAHYDVLVIGSGAGGGTMARALAGQPASVLVLERGDWLPQEKENWDPTAVWREKRYRAEELWVNRHDRTFRPFMHYMVGGNTKVWGAALLRLRESDFQPVEHLPGVSPGWPIDYQTLEPWYDRAEELYQVRGEKGLDPTEPDRKPYPHPAVPHEPFVAAAVERLGQRSGVAPFPLPLGLLRPGERGGCLLCNTCNSFPCMVRAKSDADTCGITPALEADNITLWTGAKALRLVTDPAGRRVTGVDVNRGGTVVHVTADTVVLAAGAVNSAALLLGSSTDRHPQGLANSSGLVGRNYMAHLATMIEAFHPFRVNPTSFQKTVGINDYYLAGPDRPYPLGHIQSQGRAHAPIVKAAVRALPMGMVEAFVRRGFDWLAMTEDLPDPANRVTLTSDGRIKLTYRPNNAEAHRQLVGHTVRLLKEIGYWAVVRHQFKHENTTHQCGTMAFGEDPRTSVLDTFCRSHDVENLFVTDASFFPSSAAVNPGLTVIAQTLRVADHLISTDLSKH